MVDKRKMVEREEGVLLFCQRIGDRGRSKWESTMSRSLSVGRNCRRRSDLIRYSPLLDRRLKKDLIGVDDG